MGNISIIPRRAAFVLLIALLFASAICVPAQNRATPKADFKISAIKGRVEVSPRGADTFLKVDKGAFLFPGDRVRVGPDSELAIQHTDKSVFTFAAKSAFIIPAAKPGATSGPTVRLLSGLLYFLHRGKPGFFEVETQTASAAVRGTEFNLAVDDAGVTVITMIDGLVDLKNDVDTVAVKSGEEGIAEPGKAPIVRPAINVDTVLQWTLYYPAVLDTDEIPFTEAERKTLNASLSAYRSGDLLSALNQYPSGRTERSDAESIYLAGLKLAVSQVEEAERLSMTSNNELTSPLAAALRVMIGAVKGNPIVADTVPQRASEWMAESYRLQAQADLVGALQAARNATAKSPHFGFAWSRVAELEFSFGRIDAAGKAISKALEISPRNAQALALQGFLFAARDQMKAAIANFERAIEIDPGLANAWLGRGLCLIRTGETARGREDLLIAAAQEPRRAFLRSYLGKSWADAGEVKLAENELDLAKTFDPRDPTAWLYSALLNAQNNRINEAIRELEHAQTLNTNRAIYRSEFLLDQDRAVRSVNLAKIYRDAGMTDWSVREAGRAVAADYGNYSAHLFLANSYDQLQDPYRINLRYETATESEYLIANLLAPVRAGILSQSVSQGEYSSLFERNRLGVVSTTEYLSRGAWYENGAQFGIFGNTAYSLEGIYRTDPGQRSNNDFEERDLRFQLKQQLTYKDTVLLRAGWLERSGGDLLQYYNQADANPELRTRQRQEPALTLGYHREWNPGVHTLLLLNRIDDTFSVLNPEQPSFVVFPDPAGLVYVERVLANQKYRSSFELYGGEVQQVWQTEKLASSIGLRLQAANVHTASAQTDIVGSNIAARTIAGRNYTNQFSTPFERLSIYGYEQWKLHDAILLFGGVSYDRLVYPDNHRASPINDFTLQRSQLSPKAGFVWSPSDNTRLRGAYSRSLSGASIDQSLSIEPSQVAGINQSFRSLVSESVAGSDVGASFETYGLTFESQLKSHTYIALTGELFYSRNKRSIGTFERHPTEPAIVGAFTEDLDYREGSIQFNLHQLIASFWSVGTHYRLSNSRLEVAHPEIAPGALLRGLQSPARMESTLHYIALNANFNHPVGIFAQIEAVWRTQSNSEDINQFPGDDFWHLNGLFGYRFWSRRGEITIGLLNITDEDYHLHPLTPHVELPRERTFMARARFSF